MIEISKSEKYIKENFDCLNTMLSDILSDNYCDDIVKYKENEYSIKNIINLFIKFI